MGDEGFDYLSNIKFTKSKKLIIHNLIREKISNIDGLEKFNLEDLQELDLSYNEISDIDALSNQSLKNLKILNLNNNQISNILVL